MTKVVDIMAVVDDFDMIEVVEVLKVAENGSGGKQYGSGRTAWKKER